MSWNRLKVAIDLALAYGPKRIALNRYQLYCWRLENPR